MVLDRDTAQRVLDNFVEEVVIGRGLHNVFCGAMVSVNKGGRYYIAVYTFSTLDRFGISDSYRGLEVVRRVPLAGRTKGRH